MGIVDFGLQRAVYGTLLEELASVVRGHAPHLPEVAGGRQLAQPPEDGLLTDRADMPDDREPRLALDQHEESPLPAPAGHNGVHLPVPEGLPRPGVRGPVLYTPAAGAHGGMSERGRLMPAPGSVKSAGRKMDVPVLQMVVDGPLAGHPGHAGIPQILQGRAGGEAAAEHVGHVSGHPVGDPVPPRALPGGF